MSHSNDPPRGLRLLDQVRHAIRVRHYSRRTEKAYVSWIRRYILFHGKRHPRDLREPQIAAFLTYLAVHDRVSPSTQNQALSALLFLYRHVLGIDLADLDGLVRAKRKKRLPVVLTKSEVANLLSELEGTPHLVAKLLYGSGLRLLECLQLRVKDVDFERLEIRVHEGKGGKDRSAILPAGIRSDLAEQARRALTQHKHDIARGAGWVELPRALHRKLPTAGREAIW